MRAKDNPLTGYTGNDVALDAAEVLVLDCQTSGPHARKGHIIEIGWVVCRAHQEEKYGKPIETYPVRLPKGIEIPQRVQQVTGICQGDIDAGITPRSAWNKIRCAARDAARYNRTRTCPTIVHFSRFEKPFLQELHRRYTPEQAFPLDLICTHEISRRLFPALPRRGIRALAGFFGHGVRTRRCQDHVAATVVIWRELVGLLQEKYHVHTFAELLHWLEKTPIHTHVYRSYPMERQKRRYLPDRPGVYRMLRSNGDVLYIGKAGSIRKRVNSYFTKSNHHAEHILEMLSQAKQIDITETGSALEAAILESDEIKQQSPPYNRALQTGQRAVWFCTPDLREFGRTADRRLTRGPFIHRSPITSLAAVRDMLTVSTGSWDEETALRACAMPEKYLPDIECIRTGWELFLRQHADILRTEPAEHALALLGKRFWLRDTTEPETGDNNDDEHNHVPEQEWTPEMIARVIAANVRAGTYALRRSVWLVWLTESTFAWEEVRNAKKHRNMLVFEGGKIACRQHMLGKQELRVPPGYCKGFRVRQSSFALGTFDRMRVLLTEIRTILNAGRWLAVRFGPNTILERSTLERMLQWV